MAKNNFYAVRQGRQTGIFMSWGECEKQVKGYPGAVYKGFKYKEDALQYLNDAGEKNEDDADTDVDAVAYIDGIFNLKSEKYGYGAIIESGGEEVMICGAGSMPEVAAMGNVGGQVLASNRVMEYCAGNGRIGSILICYREIGAESDGIEKWCTKEWDAVTPYEKEYSGFYDSATKDHGLKISFKKASGNGNLQENFAVAMQLAHKKL